MWKWHGSWIGKQREHSVVLQCLDPHLLRGEWLVVYTGWNKLVLKTFENTGEVNLTKVVIQLQISSNLDWIQKLTHLPNLQTRGSTYPLLYRTVSTPWATAFSLHNFRYTIKSYKTSELMIWEDSYLREKTVSRSRFTNGSDIRFRKDLKIKFRIH